MHVYKYWKSYKGNDKVEVRMFRTFHNNIMKCREKIHRSKTEEIPN